MSNNVYERHVVKRGAVERVAVSTGMYLHAHKGELRGPAMNVATDSDQKTGRSSDERQFATALAALIKNTRSHKRHLSLPEIAHWVDIATAGCGGRRELADRIGISPKMLRQFQAVTNLTPAVRQLFAVRRLDSVDMAVHLRMLSSTDQQFVAREAAQGDLTSGDVRAICEFRKEHPNVAISHIVRRVKATRNIKHYVIDFVVRGATMQRRLLFNRFQAVFGKPNIVSLRLAGALGKLIVNHIARARLREMARKERITQAEVINRIVSDARGPHA